MSALDPERGLRRKPKKEGITMTIRTYESIEFDKRPFTIVIRAEEEDLRISQSFDDESLANEVMERFHRGDEWQAWFCLVVEATILVDGVALSSRQFLGACSYEKGVNLRDVAEEHGMIEEAYRDLYRHVAKVRDALNEVEL
jgi:hypothetical protein